MNVPAHSVPSRELKQVLHNYQLFAMNALGGPAHWSAEMAKLAATAGARFTETYKAALESLQSGKDIPRSLPYDFKLPPRLPIQQKPILMPSDSRSEQGETLLEGESIACFEIGGEKRLCLPQLLKTVLSKFSLDIINQACDDLYIYCSRCNPEQLDIFKRTGNLPMTASTCGLITMTDAERLCNTLLHTATEAVNSHDSEVTRINESRIPVYHECFGEGFGYLKSDLYCTSKSECIECADCGKLFTPMRFVGHSHNNQENRICHWGFDRNNWRSYIMCDSDKIHDDAERNRLNAAFEDIINRFDPTSSSSLRKRKINDEDETENSVKNRRYSEGQTQSSPHIQNGWIASPPLTFPGPRAASGWPGVSSSMASFIRDSSVAQPMLKPKLPTQRSCPPTLENPESVVASSEFNRYEKNYVPNIALQQGNGVGPTQHDSDDMSSEADNDNVAVPVHAASIKQEEPDHNQNSPCERNQNSASPASHSDISRSSPLVKSEDKKPGATEVYMNVLENLANMERQYLQVLDMSMASHDERETMEQKYASCSDSIRRQVTNLLSLNNL